MFLTLDCLKRHREVAKRIFDAPVNSVRNDFFTANLEVQLGSEGFVLLVISKIKSVQGVVSVGIDLAVLHISQSLVDKSAKLKCCEVLQCMVGWQSGYLLGQKVIFLSKRPLLSRSYHICLSMPDRGCICWSSRMRNRMKL